MAASLALRRHAWLRGSDLNANVKSAIEDMPLDSTGLFHADTDERLNRKFRMKAAAKKHGMSSAPISPFRRRHRPWPPQGPVVCNRRPEGCLFPHRDPRVSSKIPHLRCGLRRIPLQRPPLQPCHGTESLHEVHGTGGGLPSSKGVHGPKESCRRHSHSPYAFWTPSDWSSTERSPTSHPPGRSSSSGPSSTPKHAPPFSLQTVSRR
ncbi:uncharacterized protein LOC121918688 [Sceloporus undulatus]|uniref:uncharacterized protein LOC121918688 n=1 Tax=Sceloporus undulatus TaxID=8520 RepID=UPI001C4B4C5F|nr:uncharacterized protein LOC121918688 [Sceloporus undulatus]